MSTAYQDPSSDHGTNQWTTDGGPPPVPSGHWDCVNDGVRSPNAGGDSYWLEAFGYQAMDGPVREEFGLTASPSGVGTVSAIEVWARGYAQQGSGSNVDIQADVYIAGGWLGAKGLGVTGSSNVYGSASWSGSWTKAQADAAVVAYITGGSPFYDSYWELDWGYTKLTYSSGATTFSPSNLAQPQSVGAATISQVHVLSPAGLAEAQTLGAGAVSQSHVLGAEASLHVQSLAAATVMQAHVLSADGLSQGQTLEAAISQLHLLTSDDVWQAHFLEAALLTGAHVLVPDDIPQAHTLEASALGAISVGLVTSRLALAGRSAVVGPLLLSTGLADAGALASISDPSSEVPVPLPSLTVRINHA